MKCVYSLFLLIFFCTSSQAASYSETDFATPETIKQACKTKYRHIPDSNVSKAVGFMRSLVEFSEDNLFKQI